MQMGSGVPNDWTDGTGVFPSGGTITVPADPYRIGLFVQNQSSNPVKVLAAAIYPGVATSSGTAQTNGTSVTATLAVPANSFLDIGVTGISISGSFQVVGTASSAVAVLTT